MGLKGQAQSSVEKRNRCFVRCPGKILRQKGAALLEFCLVLPIFLTLVLFSYKVGVFFYVRHALLYAGNAGARKVALTHTSFDANAYITTLLQGAGIDVARVTVKWYESGSEITPADVITKPAGSDLSLRLGHDASAWMNFWSDTSQGQAIEIFFRKEGSTCS